MKTLILCVDRDDDLGVKAKVASPVVGRKNNLRALIALGIEDPEDSDANVMLMGIKLYRKYKELGREVEIATICGDTNVGVVSDANLVRQFYSIIEQFSPDTVVLVSDGAEDEFILPVISQRVQIEHVERVVIKQAKNIESTIYIMMSALKNPKIARKVIVPIAIALMTMGILVMLGLLEVALGLLLTLIAMFLLSKALNLEGQVARMVEDMRGVVRTRRYLLFSGIVLSLLLMALGAIIAYNSAVDEDTAGRFIYFFSDRILWFIIIAAITYTLGNTLDTYIRSGKFIRSSGTLIMSLLAIGFIFMTTLEMIGYQLDYIEEYSLDYSLRWLIAGVVLLVFTLLIHQYNKKRRQRGGRKEGWLR